MHGYVKPGDAWHCPYKTAVVRVFKKCPLIIPK